MCIVKVLANLHNMFLTISTYVQTSQNPWTKSIEASGLGARGGVSCPVFGYVVVWVFVVSNLRFCSLI